MAVTRIEWTEGSAPIEGETTRIVVEDRVLSQEAAAAADISATAAQSYASQADIAKVAAQSALGVFTAPTAAVVDSVLADPTSAASIRQSTTIDAASPIAKQVQGGNFPKPTRAPILTVAESWPNVNAPFERVLWVENGGLTIYAYGYDSTLRKSIDGGLTWVLRAYLNWAPFGQETFLKTAAGSLLSINSANTIKRSANDGVTWATVGSLQAGQQPLGTQSWCIDKVTNDIYYGEYGGDAVTAMNLYRSTDDGLTWPVFHAFPGINSGHVDKISHIHAVQWDHIDQRVWIFTGDGHAAVGMYRVDAARTSVEPVLTNRMLDAEFIDAPRAIGFMPFPDYIAWASDSTSNPFLFRMARSEIGQASPVIERIYRLNSTAWFSVKASADGTRWVISASQENDAYQIDKLVHLYAVEDQGATIYEVGTLAPTVESPALPAGSLMPVGLPEDHGDFFYMVARTAGRRGVWKFRLGYGGPAAIAWPSPAPVVVAWQTLASGNVALAASESRVFAVIRAPIFAKNLHIFDIGVKDLAGTQARLDVRVTGEAYFHRSSETSERYGDRAETGLGILRYPLTGAQEVELVVTNMSASPINAVASLTYGWGQ